MTTILSAEESLNDAQARYRRCAGVSGTTSRELDLGDEAVLTVRKTSLTSDVQGVARIGVALVLVDLRMSGPSGSTGPLENALRAAVRRATGYDEGDPVAAAAQRVPPELRGYPSRTQFGYYLDNIGLYWFTDMQDSVHELSCGLDTLTTAEEPVARTWGFDQPAFTLRRGTLPDATSASQAFIRCKAGLEAGGAYISEPQSNEDMGDEWFAAYNLPRAGGGYEDPIIVSRVGGAILRLQGAMVGEPEEVMPAAVKAYRAAFS